MKTKRITRLSALLIALSMILSVMPVQFAEAAVGDVVKTIDFCGSGQMAKDATIDVDSWAVNRTKTESSILGAIDDGSSGTRYEERMNIAMKGTGRAFVVDFKVEKDGWYTVQPKIASISGLGGTYSFDVNGTDVGSMTCLTSGDAFEFANDELGAVYLKASETNQLSIKMTQTNSSAFLFLVSLTLKEAEAQEIVVGNITKKLDFCGSGQMAKDATIATDSWTVNRTKTDSSILGAIDDGSSGTRYEERMNIAMKGTGRAFVVDFEIEKDGWYSAEPCITSLASLGGTYSFEVDGTAIGSMTVFSDDDFVFANEKLAAVYLEAGKTHSLTIKMTDKGASSAYFLFLTSFTLTETEGAPVVQAKDKTLYFVDPYITSLDNDGIDSAAGWELKEHAYVGSESATAPTFYDTFMNWDLGAVGSKLSLNFKIDADGYYAPSALFGLVLDSHSPDLKVSVDGTHIGNIIAASNTGENVVFDFDTVYLTADTHTLTFEVTKNPVGERGNMYMTSFTFKVTDKPVEPTIIDFRTVSGITKIKDVNLNEYGWEISTDEEDTTPAVLGYGNTLVDYLNDYSKIKLEMKNKGEQATFNVKVDGSGNYDVSANLTTLSHYGFDADVYLDEKFVGKINSDGGDDIAYAVPVNVGTVYLDEKDVHTLKLVRRGNDTGNYLWLECFTLTPATPSKYILELGSDATGLDAFTSRDILENAWVVNDLTDDAILGRTGETVIYGEYTKAQMSEGEIYAIDFRLPYGGKYNLDSTILPVPGYGLTGKIYIDGEYVGTLNFSEGETTYTNNSAFKGIELDSGIHTLAVKRVNSTGGDRFWIYNFGFTPVDSLPTVKGVQIKLGTSTSMVGESSTVKATTMMSDDSVYEHYSDKLDGTAGDNLVITSSNTAVAEIENGVITAKAVGTSIIKAVANIGGVNYSATAEFKVVEMPEKTFNLTSDTPFPVREGRKNKVLIQGAVSNVIEDLSKATEIKATSKNDTVATATILHQDGKTYAEVQGVAEGETEITVEAEMDGITDDVTFPVKVVKATSSANPYVISFGGDTPYKDTTIENDGVEVDVDASTADFTSANTKVYGDNYKFDLPKKGNKVVIRFEIPESGSYSMDFTGWKVGMFGIVGAMYIDGKFIGEYDFRDHDKPESDSPITYNEHLRDVTLEKGIHEFVIERVNDEASKQSYMWLLSLKFTPIVVPATVAGVYVDCGKDKLLMDESINAAFTVRMSDGKDYHFPSVLTEHGRIIVDHMTAERATYADGVITAGASSGSAMFAIDVEMEDSAFTGYWDIQIADGQLFDFRRSTAGVKPSTASLVNDGWMVNDAKTTVNKNASNYDLRPAGFAATYAYGDILAIDLDILKSGAYDVDIKAQRNRELGVLADFYIDDTYLGRFDFSHPDFEDGMPEAEANKLNDVVSVQFNSIELEEGTRTLYIKRVNSDAYRRDIMWLENILFTDAEKMPEVSSITISAPSSEIALNHTLKVDAEVWMSNGRKYLFGPKLDGSVDPDNRLVFSSSNPDAFTVDQTGLMFGKAVDEGSNLVVDAYVRTKKTSKEQKFSVVRVLNISADGVLQMERTHSAITELTAVLDDVACDLNNATSIEVVPDYPSRVEGFIIKEDNKVYLQVTGLRAGETGVTVIATVDGVEGSVYVPVTVFVPAENVGDLFLDFREGSATSPGGSADAASVATHGWSVNYKLSGKDVVKSSQWGINQYGITAEFKDSEKLVFDFMVKKEGNYEVDLVGTQVGNFGILADLYIDDVYMGRFDFSHPSDKEDALNAHVWTDLNSIPLTIGTHTLVLKRVNPITSRHSYLYWGGVKFTSIDGDLTFDKARAQADKTTLAVGESVNIYTDALMSDGSVRNMGPLMNGDPDNRNKISVTNSDSSVAKIENGKITALKTGTTTIAVSATVDGETKTENVVITVDNAKIGSIEASVFEDVYVGKSVAVNVSTKSDSEPVRDLIPESVSISVADDDKDIVSVDGMNIIGLNEGTATVVVKAKLNNVEKSYEFDVTVTADGLAGITVKAMPRLIRPDSAGTQIKVEGGSFHGQVIDLSGATITYSNANPDVIDVSATGYVTPKAIGESLVTVTVEKGEFVGSGEINIVVTNGKVGRSLYTEDKVAAARENIINYSWARSEKDAAVRAADKYLDMEEFLWTAVTTQNLPRTISVGYRYDPDMALCRYCGVDMADKYGDIYAWKVDPINKPWKIQCPECRRSFPTNDFGSFYKLGIDENGNWNYEQSHREHYNLFKDEYAKKGVESYEKYAQMRTSGARLPGVGYLKNEEYLDVASVKTLNGGKGLLKTETVETWGVDDGYGYKTGYVYPNNGGVEEAHTYVAFYNQEMMTDGLVKDALKNLGLAYMYTGNAKYGRVGAILLDRVADVYPTMQTAPFFPKFYNSDSTSPYGKIDGCIWEYHNADIFARYYDALFPAFDDPYVVNFLSGKAEKYNMENDKSTPELIRQNIEDGVLREIFRSLKNGTIYGNFGLHQEPLAVAAVVLDTMPDTKEMLDYLMAKDTKSWGMGGHTGGDIYDKLLNSVDRDGGTSEGLAPNYSSLWFNSLSLIADVLNGYKTYPSADLMNNLKFQKMMEASAKLIMTRRNAVQTGDSGNYAGGSLYLPGNAYLIQGYRSSGNIKLAQLAYFQNGNTTKGLRENIFAKNPEDIADEIQDIIDKHGEYLFDESIIMPDYGFAALRGGSLYAEGTTGEKDNQRDVWVQFGRAGSHGHPSTLNIGMHAYGIDVAPEMGYPTAADGGDEYRYWGQTSINHNLVIVDDEMQKRMGNPATPLHYDDAGRVKLVDVDAPAVYAETDIYRRTLINIEANADVAYTVDFFRVKGGDEHLYSFHSQSNDIYEYEGFAPVEYGGTYAGEDVSYRTLGISNGYSYLTNIRKDIDPQTGEIAVDFAVTDYRNTVADNKNVHMRMTMLNDFELSEVTFAQGETPNREKNPGWQEFVLARRSGNDLDSTFTTVLEPYKGERYITDMKQLSVARADGLPVNTNGDVVRAIQVDLVGNRSDYIVYATNNDVEYVIDGNLVFQGFAGVMTKVDGKVTYNYINDGVKFGELETIAGYSGEVIEFERNLSYKNWIKVRFYSENVDLDALTGRHMYIENDSISNGMYLIEGVTDNGDGTVTLDIGNITLIRAATNVTADSGDYTYNIAPRQWFNIPLSIMEDMSPIVSPIETQRAASGNTMHIDLDATSQSGNPLTYNAVNLPRGASVDEESGRITWTPDKNQIGDNIFSVTVSDGLMETTVTFIVEVYKGISDIEGGANVPDSGTDDGTTGDSTGNGNSGGTTGGNSAGGGGTSQPDDTRPEDTKPEDTKPEVGEGEKFIDLGGYDWAKEAIYALAEKGVVNGTSAKTYSPANNIKRADFAIMLVRAFGITEGNGEHFADVDVNKYYAKELLLAKANGIVGGVGDNKFNPEGEITRQDMMLMLSRALDAMEVKLGDADRAVLAEFADAAQISDYARDAVASVVEAGIITGSNGRINPLAKATRAEIAVMLSRVLADK